MPCGRCRQLLWEHGGPNCLVQTPSGIQPHVGRAAERLRCRLIWPRQAQTRGSEWASIREQLRAFPKVSLHDHLDGGLRPSTVAELAGEIGHQLPATDPDDLGRWFAEAADSGSLVQYLETFEHTIAVMQTPAQLRRVAREFVEDLAADGVIYGEARWAPEQHIRAGLSAAQAIEAVRDGLAEGMDACARRGTEIVVRQLVTAMRHVEPDPRHRRSCAALPR